MKIKKTYINTMLVAGLLGSATATQAQALASDSAKVNVAFRSVDKEDLMGGVSAVDMTDLTRKNYSTYSLDNMQAYVGGYNGQLWNMGEALVVVDGVPRDANNVLPTEIEQITFLKSASAVVLYGSRAAKGAVLITTKRSRVDGLQVSVRGNATLFTPKRYPKYLGAPQYMTLYNEALANDGKSPVYSDEDIYNYASGVNPYRYPNIDFFSSDYVKKSFQRYEGIAEFQGGGRFAHFYANIGLYNVNDLMKFGEGKDNHTTRLNIRGNVDLRLNDWITGWVDANATFYDARNDNSDFWSQSATLRPTSQYPLTPLIPLEYINKSVPSMKTMIENSNYIIDGKYLIGGTQSLQTNPFASMYAAGYHTYTSRQLQFDAGVKMDLASVLKGLSFKTQFAVDYATSYTTNLKNEYACFEPVWSNVNGKDEIIDLKKYGTDKRTGIQNIEGSTSRQTILYSAQFDYDRQFGDHGVAASLLAHGYQRTVSTEYHKVTNANLGLQMNYNYLHKYYADLSMAAIHSPKLAPGHREAVSPVLSVAWRLGKERFMKDAEWIKDLKLTASYGIVNEDLDIENYYMYDQIFTATGTWWGWSESANSMQTSDSQRGANNDLTFVKRKEFRLGLNANLWDGLITLEANYFNVATNGLLTTPSTSYPSYFMTYWPKSTFLPYINYNNQRRTGFDFTVNVHKRVGEVDLQAGLTGMLYSSKNTRVSENVEYDWLKAEGGRIDALRGYQCLGFIGEEDVVRDADGKVTGYADGVAVVNNNTKPGDLKYKDQNGDGKIDSKDAVVLGHWTPDFNLGFHFTAKYKGFTLFLNMIGNFGATAIKNNAYAWAYGDRKYSDMVLGRWTPATAATATYPRLTTEGGELNFVTSDFWTYSTDAVRLNKVQLTYDLPGSLFSGKFVKGATVYVSGGNLLTIAKERKYMETAVGSAPQIRAYNLGVKVNF
jgi:TonB-linked SusC/RagA family outer membrane protein